MDIKAGQTVHFIGIGGVSMSALALSLAGRGVHVTGSDRDDGERVAELRRAGITVAVGQRAENAGHADVYVYSTAIREDNPEFAAAKATGKPLLHRSELLAAIIGRYSHSIAIAGTHGKSTTTSMLGAIYLKLGLDPTVYVGADVPDLGGTHHIGKGDTFIFEACESDASFLRYKSCSEVLTSVEPDHLDEHGTFERLQQAFEGFLSIGNPDGFLAYRADDPVVAKLSSASPARLISFGLSGSEQVSARNINHEECGAAFECIVSGESHGTVHLRMPGSYNVANALAATAACLGSGLELASVFPVLEEFRGVERRFEKLGELRGALVFDDYAHHPTEVRATLRAAREHYDPKIVAIFQPHLYSRTKFLLDQFVAAFDDANIVIFADTYAAREDPMPGVSSKLLADLVRARGANEQVLYFPSQDEIFEYVAGEAAPGQMILTIGAGDIREVGKRLAALGAQS